MHYHWIWKNNGASSDVDEMLLLLEEVAFRSNEVLQGMWVGFVDLGQPFVQGMIEGLGVDQGEADEEDVGVGIGEGAESFILVLASGVPEPEFDEVVLILDSGKVVVEDSGHVVVRKGIGGVADEQ